MGLVAKVLSFILTNRNNANISDVIVKSGGNLNLTAEQYIPFDKQPLKTDYACIVTDSGTGRYIVVGYQDPINPNEANLGEEGLKGRNKNAQILCRVFARNNGSVVINNDNGSFILNPDGIVNINGVTIDTQGNIVSPSSVSSPNISATQSMTISGKELSNHTHPAGTPPGNTGVNN